MNRKFFLAGATGATGQRLARMILDSEDHLCVVVRSRGRLPKSLQNHPNIRVVEKALLDLSEQELNEALTDCEAIFSCLGHNLTWKGIFGEPRRLVTQAAQRLCESAQTANPGKPVKYILMNTVSVRNSDLNEPRSAVYKAINSLLRLLPPHTDNEQAADYLRLLNRNTPTAIEWAVVRPDGLIDAEEVTPYDIFPSPTRNPLFNPGKTSRINTAHFMHQLACDDELWKTWKGQMPAIYNR
ncbi:MAG: NAD(P)-binding oxidoreductase [Verrucomicrobiota bacterium]